MKFLDVEVCWVLISLRQWGHPTFQNLFGITILVLWSELYPASHSQIRGVRLRFLGHDKTKTNMGVAIAIDPFQVVYYHVVIILFLFLQQKCDAFTNNFRYLKWRLSWSLFSAIFGVGELP